MNILQDWHTDRISKVMIPKIGRNSSVSTVTWLRAGESGVRNPVEATSSPKRPDRLWSPLSLLFNGYQGSYPGVKRPRRKMTNCLYPAPRWRMSGARPQFPLYAIMARGRKAVTFTDFEMAERCLTHSSLTVALTVRLQWALIKCCLTHLSHVYGRLCRTG